MTSQHLSSSSGGFFTGQRVCDSLVTGGVLFLIPFTPLAFGAVHPWAYSLLEVVIFLLVLVWLGRLFLETRAQKTVEQGERGADRSLARLLLPLALFLVFVLLQLLPLPPAFLRVLSPATYEVYVHSLPGWPERMPYESLASIASVASIESGESGESVASEERSLLPSTPNSELRTPNSSSGLWRSLSIAPQLTSTDLLKFVAYASLFLVVLCYPFGSSRNDQRPAVSGQPRSEERFFRVVLLTILCSGLLVATLGVVQRFTWNGKVLWFFIPYDWEARGPILTPRASGPFVSYIHFANYLSLIFPLALVGVLSGNVLGRCKSSRAGSPIESGTERLLCGVTAFTLAVGILLSLSRGGWIGAGLGAGILLALLLSAVPERRPAVLRQPQGLSLRLVLAGGLFLLVLVLFFVGPAGRSQVDSRLEQTVIQEGSLPARMAVWQESAGMIRDFPLFGVGLGAWPELFPRYRQPPWSRLFFDEAHNDYLELLAETGLLGFGLLARFFWRAGRRLYQGLWTVSPHVFPVFAALMAALGAMAFHEFFDFNLQIPANALLFTLLLALALRLTRSGDPSFKFQGQSRLRIPVLLSGGVVVATLCVLALKQERLPYPYDVEEPASLVKTRERLDLYPAHAALHRSLVFLAQDYTTPADWLKEFESALWLNPLDPYTRDLYAGVLESVGREEEGLQEVARSVSFAPSRAVHLYLHNQWIPTLSDQKKKAIEDGFRTALATGYEGAVEELGDFYIACDRFAEAGKLYEEAALQAQDSDKQVRYLLNAGLAYARAEDLEKAETLLRQVTQIAPRDPQAYQYLATRVFAPKGDVASAKAVVSEGKKRGADAFALSLSLAEAAQKAGDLQETKAALQEALTLQPSSFDANFRLGQVYLQERNFDRATLLLRKATNLRPDTASAFYYLGVAEERRYQFSAAQQAYARAVELAPDNNGFQERYQAFQRKVAGTAEKKG